MAADLFKLGAGASKAKTPVPSPAPEASAKDDAAADAIAAIKAGDAKALSLALERHYEACQSSEEYEEAPEEV